MFALRILVSISPIGSDNTGRSSLLIQFLELPTCLTYTGDLTLVRKLAETNTTNAILAQSCVGATTDVATIVCPYRKFWLAVAFNYHRFFRHNILLVGTDKGHTKQ